MTATPDRPVEIPLDDTTPPPAPAEAPPPEDSPPAAVRSALPLPPMGRGTRVWALFRWALGALVMLAAGLWLEGLVRGLAAREDWAGRIALLLLAAAGAALLLGLLRELAALARLGRIERLRRLAEQAARAEGPEAGRALIDRLARFFRNRPGLAPALAALRREAAGAVDSAPLLHLAERRLLAPLDAAAIAEIEAAARRVALITALVPLPLADVLAALAINLRMIRRVAEIYGGRGGALGSWRLLRRVAAHLAATGAVAVGDDLLGPLAGGGLLSRLSRRFGEGAINGALTAKVGIAALEVCRPLPFRALDRPALRTIVRRAVTGAFGAGPEADGTPR